MNRKSETKPKLFLVSGSFSEKRLQEKLDELLFTLPPERKEQGFNTLELVSAILSFLISEYNSVELTPELEEKIHEEVFKWWSAQEYEDFDVSMREFTGLIYIHKQLHI